MDVWLPLATLIIGLVGGGGLEWLRDERAYRREREARLDLSLQQRRQLHREFQRETVLELQEVLHKFTRAVGAANVSRWGSHPPDPAVESAVLEGSLATQKLGARVADDQIREWLEQYRALWLKVVTSSSSVDAGHALDAMTALLLVMNERIGQLLRSRPEADDDTDEAGGSR
jgi:hypothetical protein